MFEKEARIVEKQQKAIFFEKKIHFAKKTQTNKQKFK